MNRIPFDARELETVGTLPTILPGRPGAPALNTPVSSKENFLVFMAGEKPLWTPHSLENCIFCPDAVPDNRARGQLSISGGCAESDYGGPDMFGIDWEYVPAVKGSMVRPGAPRVPDIERWEDFITFPDVESWDWEGCARATESLRPRDHIVCVSQFTGFFERLISFADMTDALVAMVDEDAQEAVHRLFSRLCDLYEALFEKYEKYFAPDMVWFHDDWGSQRAPFFSPATAREMLLPYLKRVTESAHRHGMLMHFHSCGKIEMLVPLMIEAGVDIWGGQDINDKRAVLKEYGDRLTISLAPETPADASPEELKEACAAWVAEFSGKRCYIGRGPNTTYGEMRLLYELSRKALGG